jgi:hypothetical protein
MKVNIIICSLAAVFAQCCLGQTDTNLLATGDWSETVSDHDHTLRGRLLVYGGETSGATNHARVYLELQNVVPGIWHDPVEVYFPAGGRFDLRFEMRDRLDHPIEPELAGPYNGPPPKPFWLTLPCESTVRLRTDAPLGPLSKKEGLKILVTDFHCWIIPPNATNDFYLSATFTPPQDHPSSLHYHVWQGTLKLPKVKIPSPTP